MLETDNVFEMSSVSGLAEHALDDLLDKTLVPYLCLGRPNKAVISLMSHGGGLTGHVSHFYWFPVGLFELVAVYHMIPRCHS